VDLNTLRPDSVGSTQEVAEQNPEAKAHTISMESGISQVEFDYVRIHLPARVRLGLRRESGICVISSVKLTQFYSDQRTEKGNN
jgi:hypothetical protein